MEGLCNFGMERPLSAYRLVGCSLESLKIRILRKKISVETWLVKFQGEVKTLLLGCLP